jgi:hypothetical protein
MVQYFFKVRNAPDLGPMGADEFQQRLAAGEIKDGTMVWRSGMANWSTYADLCAAETRRAAPAPPQPPPMPDSPRKASPEAASPKTKFLACRSCGKEWPENLLFDGTCGICMDRQKAEAEKGKKKAGAGTGLIGWFFIALSIVSAVAMIYRLFHPLPPPPKEKVKEFTEPAKYGR